MDLEELANDVWERFCKLDDKAQVMWMKKFVKRPISIVLMKDINQYFDSIYHGDYLAFYQTMRAKLYETTFKHVRKWFIHYDFEEQWEGDTLLYPAYYDANLLKSLKGKAFCKVLGYTEKEIEEIQLLLNIAYDEELDLVWKNVLKEKMENWYRNN